MKRAFTARAASLLTWVLLLIAVPTGLYVSHVFNQLGEVRENNLRTLSKAAETTNQILSTALQNVGNLENEPGFICQFLSRQPYLSWGAPGTCETAGMETSGEVVETAADRAEKARDTFQYAFLHAGSDGVQVKVPFKATEGSTLPGETDEALFTFDIAMDALLAAIPFSDALDLLFVADETGDVVHQHRPAARRDVGLLVSSLEGLSTGSGDEPLSTTDLKRASSINRVRISGVDYQLLCQPLMLGLDESGDNGESVDSRDSDNWVLCGLVASERSLRQSLVVAPFLAFMFFAVTVFGFLTWPAIKLLWMTKTDRLYFVDLCFLLFGTLGALMLASILILGVGSHRSLSTAAEASLRQLASQLEHNLQEEVAHLTRTLTAFDHAVGNILDSGRGPEDGGTERLEERWLRDVVKLYSSDDPSSFLFDAWKEAMAENSDEPREDWPIESDFQMVFWTDCDGHQLLKATSFNRNTPRVDIGRRKYFRAAVEDRLWQPISSGESAVARYVEPLRSVTTGKFATIVSIRSDVPMSRLGNAVDPAPKHEVREGCRGSAALQAVLISTSNAVLPPGVGFAIVDEQGTAVLHSDERRALFENLYEELEDGDRLQSMILARAEQSMPTNYLGRPHQVFVKPLVDLPWFVVTFADTEMVSTANLEILGHAAVLAFIFLAVYVVLAVIYFGVRGPKIPLWFWPGAHGGPMAHWALTIPVISLITMILLMVLLHNRDDILLLAVFLMPLAIFAAIWGAYHWIPRHGIRAEYSQDVRPRHVRSSIAASMIAWIVIAILPAGIFFASALENQASLLVRYENEYLAASMAERNCAIDDYYRSVDRSRLCPEGSSHCRFESRRSLTAGDLYPSTVFWPKPVEHPRALVATERIQVSTESFSDCGSLEPESTNIWAVFSGAKPIYNPTVLRSRYLSPDKRQVLASNACWSWNPVADGSPGQSEFRAGPLPCNTLIKLKSRRPLAGLYYGHPAVLGSGALLLLFLFFWARYGARNLFFGDLRMPSKQLRDREELERRLSKKPNDSKVRIAAVAASQNDRSSMLRTPKGLDTSTQGHHNRYDMLDYVAGSSKREDLRKTLVNDLVAGTNILLISPVDPYSLLDTDETPEPADPNDTAAIQIAQDRQREIRRWRRILSRFRIVIVTVNQDPPPRESKGIWQRELDRIVTDRWLSPELEALPELKPLHDLLSEEVIGSTRRNALDRIVERAFGTYMALWDACTEDEKLVLVQIAFENVVNPKQVAIVRHLMQRGLLVRDPGLRIMNQSFARFIVQVQEPAEVKGWERPTTGISWVHSRWALLGVLLLALMFLWATQRELFNTTITFLTAAAIGLPGMVKVMTNLNRLNVHGNK